jgi:hypothetical protein
MLSHAVLSVMQVFHLYDVEYELCLRVRDVVFHPSRCDLTVWGSMLWFEQWLEWWRWVIASWHVVLESAKDWILGVDTLGQNVSLYVWNGATCLLIRNTIGCVSFLEEWELAWCTPIPLSAREACGGNLSTTSGAYGGNCSKTWHTPIVDRCNDMYWSLSHTPKDV